MSFVEIQHDVADVAAGYFRSIDISKARISLTPHQSNDNEDEVRIPPTKMLRFRKFTVDRLGRKFEVSREVRTWRGKACT
jgi:CRISPR-associated endonuclease Csn1